MSYHIDPSNVEQSIQKYRSLFNGLPLYYVRLQEGCLDNTNAECLASFLLKTQDLRVLAVGCRVMDDGAAEQMSKFLRSATSIWHIRFSRKAYLSLRWITEGLSTNPFMKYSYVTFGLPSADSSQSWGSAIQEILFAKRDFLSINFDWRDTEPDITNLAQAMEGVAVQTNTVTMGLKGSTWRDESAASFLQILGGSPAAGVLKGLRIPNGELGSKTMKVLEESFLAGGNIRSLELPWKLMARPDIKMKFWKRLKHGDTTLKSLEPCTSIRYMNTIVDVEIQQFCKRNQDIERVKAMASRPIGIGIWGREFSRLAAGPENQHISPLFLALKANVDELVSLQPDGNRKKRPRSTGLLQNVNVEDTQVTKPLKGMLVVLLAHLHHLHPWDLQGFIFLAKCANDGDCFTYKSLFDIVPALVWDCHIQQLDPLSDLSSLSAEQSEWLSKQINNMDPVGMSDAIKIVQEVAVEEGEGAVDLNVDQLDNTAQKKLFHHVSKIHVNSCIGCLQSLPPQLQHRLDQLFDCALFNKKKQESSDLTLEESHWLIEQAAAINDNQLRLEIAQMILSAGVQPGDGGSVDLAQIPMATQRELLHLVSKAQHESVQQHWNAE